MSRKTRTTVPSYGSAVLWLAHNDEPTLHDIGEISYLCTVALVADLFGIDATDVAIDVVRSRHGAGRWAFTRDEIVCTCPTAEKAKASAS